LPVRAPAGFLPGRKQYKINEKNIANPQTIAILNNDKNFHMKIFFFALVRYAVVTPTIFKEIIILGDSVGNRFIIPIVGQVLLTL